MSNAHTKESYFAPIKAQLDRDRPEWFIDWASGADLKDWIREAARSDRAAADKMLKARFDNRIHYILNAAIEVGLVNEG